MKNERRPCRPHLLRKRLRVGEEEGGLQAVVGLVGRTGRRRGRQSWRLGGKTEYLYSLQCPIRVQRARKRIYYACLDALSCFNNACQESSAWSRICLEKRLHVQSCYRFEELPDSENVAETFPRFDAIGWKGRC
jgi:hypothetical protein